MINERDSMKHRRIQCLWILICTAAVFRVFSEDGGKAAEEVWITVDAANVREKPEKNARIKFRLPYGTRISGAPIDTDWFRIDKVSNGEQGTIPVTGYVHKMTFARASISDGYSGNSVEAYAKKEKVSGKDYLELYERAHAINPTDTPICRKLYHLYTECGNGEKAAHMDSLCRGLSSVIIAAPLLDGSIVVLGKLLPDGEFEKMTFQNEEGGIPGAKGQEAVRIQMTSVKWITVGNCLPPDQSFIYPEASFETFGEDEMGTSISWVQLTRPTQRIHDIYKVSLNPEYVLASQKCTVIETESVLGTFTIVNNRKRTDSLFTWLFPDPCTVVPPIKPSLASVTALAIPGTPYIDLSFQFLGDPGRCQGMARAIVDTTFKRMYVGSGSAGLWFRPESWKHDVRITLAPHSNSLEECESKNISIWIDVIVIVNRTTVKIHEVSLGGWG